MDAVEEIMCVVCVCITKGHSGDARDLAPTLCKYDFRKGDLFVLSWARVRRVRRGSISSVLIMCGGGVCCGDLWECVMHRSENWSRPIPAIALGRKTTT